MPKKYTLGEELGKGAFGSVHAATDEQGLTYAIKIQDFSDFHDTQAADTEAQICKEMGLSLEHYTIQRGDKFKHYTVMHKINGLELAKVIQQKSNSRSSERHHEIIFLRQYLQLVNQLEMLHTKGYIHTDIKPANIMWGEPPRLVDFGLCLDCADYQSVMRGVSSSYSGTPYYSAPELQKIATVGGEEIFSEKTDNYSLAQSMQEYFAKFFNFRGYSNFFAQAMDANPTNRLSVAKTKSFLQQKLETALQLNTHPVSSATLTSSELFANFFAAADNLSVNHAMGVFHGNISANSFAFSKNIQNASLTHYEYGLEQTGVPLLDSEKFTKMRKPIPSAEEDTRAFIRATCAILRSTRRNYEAASLEILLQKEKVTLDSVKNSLRTLLAQATAAENAPKKRIHSPDENHQLAPPLRAAPAAPVPAHLKPILISPEPVLSPQAIPVPPVRPAPKEPKERAPVITTPFFRAPTPPNQEKAHKWEAYLQEAHSTEEQILTFSLNMFAALQDLERYHYDGFYMERIPAEILVLDPKKPHRAHIQFDEKNRYNSQTKAQKCHQDMVAFLLSMQSVQSSLGIGSHTFAKNLKTLIDEYSWTQNVGLIHTFIRQNVQSILQIMAHPKVGPPVPLSFLEDQHLKHFPSLRFERTQLVKDDLQNVRWVDVTPPHRKI